MATASQFLVEGIEAYTNPRGTTEKGQLSLPPEFDGQQFSARWVEHGPKVKMAQQPVYIASESVRAQGWQVWKDEKGKPCFRTLSKGQWVLMFQPKVLRQAINKIHGNASKRRMIQEGEGETIVATQRSDRGLLPAKDLARIGLEKGGSAFEGNIQFNSLQTEVESPVVATIQKPKTAGKRDWLKKD